MNQIARPALANNHCMLHERARAPVVDPGAAASAHATLDALGLQLAGILVTRDVPTR